MADISNCSALDSTPITNGNRKLASSLKEALDTVIKKTMRGIKFSTLRHHYSEIFNENPESLRKLQKDVVTQLQENINLEISKICEDENVEALLNSLDDIILENSKYIGQIAWRPMGNPHEDLRDHLYDSKLKHKEELDKMLKELNEENEILSSQLKENHDKILDMNCENEKLMYDFQKGVNLLEDNLIGIEDTLLLQVSNEN